METRSPDLERRGKEASAAVVIDAENYGAQKRMGPTMIAKPMTLGSPCREEHNRVVVDKNWTSGDNDCVGRRPTKVDDGRRWKATKVDAGSEPVREAKKILKL
ncbi:hypothetical protein DEO72_LG11g2005 [Vigna unguiculata]|uniref:Uncharacterized protein n=1 Tax=Vigna unguiculata TaxID=3917 RepID=A0A4D6NTB9_VIGUN|nr:hypothetical protein DEO72_LG11g2005 [Vigna unguiculata]